jgi:hypothetical protein
VRIHRLKLLFLAALTSMALAPAAFAGGAYSTVQGPCTDRGCGTWAYSHAGYNSQRMEWLANGSRVRVSCAAGWAKIGKNRYIRTRYLKIPDHPTIYSCRAHWVSGD